MIIFRGLGMNPGFRDVPVGKLLVVDDEAMIRESVAAILASFGFEVIEARDGLDALLIFQAKRAEIMLIIMDVSMPRMDGIAAANVIKAADPTAKVILMTGFTEIPLPVEVDAILPKPFKSRVLRDTVAQVLKMA